VTTFYRAVLLAILAGLMLAACGSDDPSKTSTQGAELLSVAFDAVGSWEEGAFTDADDGTASTLAIINGRYQIDHRSGRGASFTWGAGGDAYENVIIEVEAEQFSDENDNLYGVLCRLATDDSGNASGYALLISGDGHYGIAEFRGSSLDFLLEWHQTNDIHKGQAANTIRAVCVDDYLALYANGKFLGEARDDTYRRAGQVGLLAGITGDASVRVAFDDLKVYEGSVK